MGRRHDIPADPDRLSRLVRAQVHQFQRLLGDAATPRDRVCEPITARMWSSQDWWTDVCEHL